MRELRGNVWRISKVEDDIVIPTNIGWRTNGQNVMGRGLARQAADYYPRLPAWYGEICQEHEEATPVVRYGPLLLFPVKPLNKLQPYMSWQQPASLDLISRSLEQLSCISSRTEEGLVFVPLVGCGNGGLDPEDVEPMIECVLGHDERFVIVRR